MCNIFDMPREWAQSDSKSEGEAFEQALKRIKPEDRLKAVEQENAELRRINQEKEKQIRLLREAIARGQESWDYD